MLLNKFNFTSLGKCFPTGAKEGVLLLSIASLRPKMIFQISPKYHLFFTSASLLETFEVVREALTHSVSS